MDKIHHSQESKTFFSWSSNNYYSSYKAAVIHEQPSSVLGIIKMILGMLWFILFA